MSELLFVVERQRPEVYASLKRNCLDVENVQVVLDRRQQERRRSAARLDRDRRRSERRIRKIDEELTSLGFAIVKRDPPAHESFGQSPGAQVAPIDAETASFLASVPLFSGFSREEIDQLAERVRLRRLRTGQILFEEGDPGE